MGGTGSGRFGDGGTCDNHSRLDVRFLHRRLGALRAATLTGTFLPGVLSWHCQGVPRGRAGFSCEADPADPSRAGAIGLAFRWRPAGEERWRDCAVRVAVEWTPCRYGGARPWWRCPGCGSRARRAVLYLAYGTARAGFLCRACARGPVLPVAARGRGGQDPAAGVRDPGAARPEGGRGVRAVPEEAEGDALADLRPPAAPGADGGGAALGAARAGRQARRPRGPQRRRAAQRFRDKYGE